jgi:hypothetical protein
MIKFVSDLWQVSGFLQGFVSSTKITDRHEINSNIVESGIKHQKTKPNHVALSCVDDHLRFSIRIKKMPSL